MKSIAVYCGSSNKVDTKYREEAKKVGKFLAQNKIQLVYGGGNMGLMGDIANSALHNGGEVFGGGIARSCNNIVEVFPFGTAFPYFDFCTFEARFWFNFGTQKSSTDCIFSKHGAQK